MTVGELMKFLGSFGSDCRIDFPTTKASAVKGLEIAYEIATDSLQIKPVYQKKSVVIDSIPAD